MNFDFRNMDTEELLSEKLAFPFLFTTYFVLSVYQHNINQVRLVEVIRPLIIFLTGTVSIYFFIKYFLSDFKAALITFVSSISFYTYNIQVEYGLKPLLPLNVFGFNLARRRYLLLANAVLVTAISALIIYKELDKENLTKILNIVTSFLLGLTLSGIVIGLSGPVNQNLENNIEISAGSSVDESQPSIYYIIPDRYARGDVLRKQYGFDNKNFINSLRRDGFYVANESYANYPFSYGSLGSSLNMQYLQDIGVDESVKQKQVYSILQDHQVQKFLRSQDYRYHHIGLNYRATAFNRNADQNINHMRIDFGGLSVSEFETNLLKNTPVIQVLNEAIIGRDKATGNLKSVKSIRKISEKPERKFVFAHLMIPHPAFVFNATGDKIKPHSRPNLPRSEKYLGQLQATNKFLNRTVDRIIENEGEDVIIIIQSDSGPGVEEAPEKWTQGKPETLRKRAGILNAVRAPELNGSKMYQRMTPVNTFRTIFNEYFKTGLKMKKDKVYFRENPPEHNFFQLENKTLHPE